MRLWPIALLLTATGTVALLLALSSAVIGLPVAPAMLITAISLLVAGHSLSESRPWSLRVAHGASVVAALVWLGTLVALGGPTDVAVFCLSMIGASLWAHWFIGAEIRGPTWLQADGPRESPMIETREGWIEELPE